MRVRNILAWVSFISGIFVWFSLGLSLVISLQYHPAVEDWLRQQYILTYFLSWWYDNHGRYNHDFYYLNSGFASVIAVGSGVAAFPARRQLKRPWMLYAGIGLGLPYLVWFLWQAWLWFDFFIIDKKSMGH